MGQVPRLIPNDVSTLCAMPDAIVVVSRGTPLLPGLCLLVGPHLGHASNGTASSHQTSSSLSPTNFELNHSYDSNSSPRGLAPLSKSCRTISRIASSSSSCARFLARHALTPSENGIQSRCISIDGPSSHRSGLKAKGSGKTEGLKCKVNSWQPTIVPVGRWWPAYVQPVSGTMRGRRVGVDIPMRSPSRMTASRYLRF